MYIINDIELLQKLYIYKILTAITNECKIGVTEIRLTEYSLTIRNEIEKIERVEILEIDDEFTTWSIGKGNLLSLGELSSIYITLLNNKSTLLVSDEDKILETEAKKDKINYLRFEKLVDNLKEDSKVVQLYNFLKAV